MLGWISVHRKITDNWLWQKKPFSYGQAWIDILLECSHEEHKVLIKGVLLTSKRSESLKSIKTWAKRWGWTISATRHFLNLLEKDTMIQTKNEQVTTRLSVCNYDSYQDIQLAKRSQKDSKRIAKGSQKNTDNNGNNGNNDNNRKTMDERSKEFMEELELYTNEFPKEMLKDFHRYWSEPNKSKSKMRCEMEKTWETKRRLATWKGRSNGKYDKPEPEYELSPALKRIKEISEGKHG
ncbi:MAG: hypothetical protein KKH44_07755 [Bacteroidetes bacterium]|nr:hypothetical protein [Bacteroidota bacterium]